jgi:NDP-sugar pyrophosphorylase family protein
MANGLSAIGQNLIARNSMKAMIFAAGLGTRLKPLTNNKPKALVEILGKTLLQHCVENLKKQGISDIVINVHHFSSQIINLLKHQNNFGANVQISDESEALLDTGGGILKAKPLLSGNGPILLLNVDVLTNLDFSELKKFHLKEQALASLVVRKRETSRYLLFDETNQLTGWKNSKTGETKISREREFKESTAYAFSGIQAIQPKLLDLIEEQGKFSVIDLYLRLAKTQTIKAFVDEKSIWMDLGKYEQIGQAEQLVKQLERK